MYITVQKRWEHIESVFDRYALLKHTLKYSREVEKDESDAESKASALMLYFGRTVQTGTARDLYPPFRLLDVI